MDFSKIDVEKLRKGFAFLREEPRRLMMSAWIMQLAPDSEDIFSNDPPCGTVCCFGGGIVLANLKLVELGKIPGTVKYIEDGHEQYAEIEDLALNLLNIPYTTAEGQLFSSSVFYVAQWNSLERREEFYTAGFIHDKAKQVACVAKVVTEFLAKYDVVVEGL